MRYHSGVAERREVMHIDDVIGRNVRRLRDAAGLSQADLAQQMAERGAAAFYPQTITKIENSARSLKFSEASILAGVLGVPLDAILDPSATTVSDLRLARTHYLRDEALEDLYVSLVRFANADDDFGRAAQSDDISDAFLPMLRNADLVRRHFTVGSAMQAFISKLDDPTVERLETFLGPELARAWKELF